MKKYKITIKEEKKLYKGGYYFRLVCKDTESSDHTPVAAEMGISVKDVDYNIEWANLHNCDHGAEEKDWKCMLDEALPGYLPQVKDAIIMKKIDDFNRLQQWANQLQHQIWSYLEMQYDISDTRQVYLDGKWTVPFGIDGDFPIRVYDSTYDPEMVKKIIDYCNEFTEKVGEKPTNADICRHLQEVKESEDERDDS